MSISRVGVDIAKSVFHVHGVDRHDLVEWRGKYKRDKWLDAIAKRKRACAINISGSSTIRFAEGSTLVHNPRLWERQHLEE